uniref:Mesoderm posterior aa n=1 Tax=Acanthochromis polyacanthus TaxID=80966 RepID=A0A3Q1EJ71_9TELE
MEQPPCPFSLFSACLIRSTQTAQRSGKNLHPQHQRHLQTSTTEAMELQENSFLFDCESLLDKSLAYDPTSDPGYASACSSLSPTSSVDSFCFSPTSLQKSRSRYPGKKRQTASEREKLRMRDLTKALLHLRSFLPPSVAPAAQTLTKIETLRLTIRYISYLSAQLGLSEEVLEQRRSSGFVMQNQTLSLFLDQPTANYSPQESGCNTMSPVMFGRIHSFGSLKFHTS